MAMCVKDHPRSRGVYLLSGVTLSLILGSSPLARGLLGEVLSLMNIIGIIPARAGFTRAPHRASEGQGIIPARAGFTLEYMRFPYTVKDHPRSRGVYPVGRVPDHLLAGSSPLARGLRRHVSGGSGVVRIIPARAGFT